MTEEQAREILKDYIQKNGGLYCLGHYLCWNPGEKTITLDDDFKPEELEAIAFWMRRHQLTDKRP